MKREIAVLAVVAVLTVLAMCGGFLLVLYFAIFASLVLTVLAVCGEFLPQFLPRVVQGVPAMLGSAAAQYRLGNYWAFGEGVEHDCTAAARWWRKAAEQGHAKAQ
ncbi:MAG: hypothetical protein LIO63_08395, partial [Akkermansia sp.]|nr:hypothetical protein [Akkermansia sp.]